MGRHLLLQSLHEALRGANRKGEEGARAHPAPPRAGPSAPLQKSATWHTTASNTCRACPHSIHEGKRSPARSRDVPQPEDSTCQSRDSGPGALPPRPALCSALGFHGVALSFCPEEQMDTQSYENVKDQNGLCSGERNRSERLFKATDWDSAVF